MKIKIILLLLVTLSFKICAATCPATLQGSKLVSVTDNLIPGSVNAICQYDNNSQCTISNATASADGNWQSIGNLPAEQCYVISSNQDCPITLSSGDGACH